MTALQPVIVPRPLVPFSFTSSSGPLQRDGLGRNKLKISSSRIFGPGPINRQAAYFHFQQLQAKGTLPKGSLPLPRGHSSSGGTRAQGHFREPLRQQMLWMPGNQNVSSHPYLGVRRMSPYDSARSQGVNPYVIGTASQQGYSPRLMSSMMAASTPGGHVLGQAYLPSRLRSLSQGQLQPSVPPAQLFPPQSLCASPMATLPPYRRSCTGISTGPVIAEPYTRSSLRNPPHYVSQAPLHRVAQHVSQVRQIPMGQERSVSKSSVNVGNRRVAAKSMNLEQSGQTTFFCKGADGVQLMKSQKKSLVTQRVSVAFLTALTCVAISCIYRDLQWLFLLFLYFFLTSVLYFLLTSFHLHFPNFEKKI